ncbi:glycoside hydrolase family 15 protein [Pseudoxanthobacter sp.]|uniref:glycoside hydrolase family 15 protein n=1 Tax=Pseudoxanthobacter sp. TaxID=1925742 RepID=UPI002FDFCD00
MIVPPDLNLAVIGNSHIAALVDRSATIVWACWPRLDGDPVFCALTDGDEPDSGFFAIEFAGPATFAQDYVRNTAIVRTVATAADGSASMAITDFAPRLTQNGRIHRPSMIVRRVEPLSGTCRIRVRVRPRAGYGGAMPPPILGSNHLRWGAEGTTVRLTTDAPVAYIAGENAFVLTRPLTFILHTNETLPDAPAEVGKRFLAGTRGWWLDWVRSLNLPYEWQKEVIRAAITLQLCAVEETGGIVAALTTSIPESNGSERNWDYRFCWLRDAFFTVHALNRVGATRTMEHFIDYVTNVIALEGGGPIRPVYAVVPEQPLDEWVAGSLAGYRGHRPVRIGNAAGEQVQHDVYGSVILAAWQMFWDERLPDKGDAALFALLERLGERARAVALSPDAGIWEYRGRAHIHTHSAAMCWVACDRLARIAVLLGLEARAIYWRAAADSLRDIILARAWNPEIGAFAGSLDGAEIDASVLLLHELGIVEPADPRFVATVEHLGERLSYRGHLRRYLAPDDFGVPEVAFTICTFWYVDALAAIGRVEEARALFGKLLRLRNHVGLYSEDIDPVTGALWGNFPQTYSMAGLIVVAMRLSRGWERAS